MSLVLLSERTADECHDALDAEVRSPGSHMPGKMVGRVDPRSFSFAVAHAMGNGAPFTASGRLVPVRGGTRIDLVVAPPRYVVLWLIAGILILGLEALAFRSQLPFFGVFLLLQAVPPFLFARRDRSRLLHFVSETLDARVVEPRPRVAAGNEYREAAEDPALEEIEPEPERPTEGLGSTAPSPPRADRWG